MRERRGRGRWVRGEGRGGGGQEREWREEDGGGLGEGLKISTDQGTRGNGEANWLPPATGRIPLGSWAAYVTALAISLLLQQHTLRSLMARRPACRFAALRIGIHTGTVTILGNAFRADL